MSARQAALDALLRIEEGAYANIALPAVLERSGLSSRDRAFATELAYGTTRMRRALDHVTAPYVRGELDADVRAMVRMGAYQLVYLHTPPHAAVSATVDIAPPRTRGFVNAVLRKVAGALPPRFPDPPTRLSYPDWIVRRLAVDLGAADAEAALEQMNVAPAVSEREDGYVQDLASQWVAGLVDAGPGQLVADMCAAPGGKATAIAEQGAALVVAGDLQPHRAHLIARNVGDLGLRNVAVLRHDGRCPPLRSGALDRVLVDAPCSGLGVLRRRPDARWRVEHDAIDRLAELQRELLAGAMPLLRAGGMLVFSVCTMTNAETLDIDRWLAEQFPELTPVQIPGPPWRPHGRGGLLLPQDAGTDGMFILRLRRS